MDFNKPRPIPSKAALRVLYQLAYISSGTLVGVATLCAEERRRRTQIVQNIADNARRIRQSPRYNHHASVATTISADSDHVELFDSRTPHRKWRRDGGIDAEKGARAPYLPSAIAEGYAHLAGGVDSEHQVGSHQLGNSANAREMSSFPRQIEEKRAKPSPGRSRHTHIFSATRQIPPSRRHLRSSLATVKPSRVLDSTKTSSVKASASEIPHPDSPLLSNDPPFSTNEHPLLGLWRKTQNLTLVLDKISQSHDEARKHGHEKELLELDSIKVQLLIQAGQLESAGDALQSMTVAHGDTADASMLHAILHAKRGEWSGAFQSLDTLNQDGVMTELPRLTQGFNKLIQLHTADKGCVETWKFVTRLEQHYGFKPDDRTTAIMMASIVIDKKYELLQAWLDHVKRITQPFRMHGMHAADLMTRYYHQQHPSAKQVQIFCSDLNRSVPDLAGSQYRPLIKTAMGYELTQRGRRVHGHDESLLCNQLDELEEEFPDTTSRDKPDMSPSEFSIPTPPVQPSQEQPSRVEVHADMFLALSRGQYAEVLRLYHASLDSEGLPMSTIALETAAKASLRLSKGDARYAKEVLEHAWDRGVSKSVGQSILAIYDLQAMSIAEQSNMECVRKRVRAYHDLSGDVGFAPSPRVWHVAANILIKNGQGDEALELLRDFYSMNPAGLQQLTSSSMASFLNGFATTHHLKGIQWVVKTILDQNVHVSESYLRAFRRIFPKTYLHDPATAKSDASSTRYSVLADLYSQCKARRDLQNETAIRDGQRLVQCLIACAKQQKKAPLPSQQRAKLDWALFGSPEEPVESGDEDKVDASADTLIAQKDLESLKSTLVHEVGLTQVVHRQQRAHNDLLWKLRYRRFYDRDVLLADGAVACFRYFCPGTSDTCAKVRFSANKEKTLNDGELDSDELVHISIRSQACI